MKISVYPRILLACGLLAIGGCSKKSDPDPAPTTKTTPTPPASGSYTDPSGASVSLSGLYAKVLTAVAQPGTGAAQQAVNVYGTLPDGRVVRVGYTVVQSGFASTPGAITSGALPFIAGPYAVGVSVSGYSHTSYTTGAIALESASPVLLSGSFRGPLLGANTTTQPPVATVAFAHVPIQP